jgi:hypothetical protein
MGKRKQDPACAIRTPHAAMIRRWGDIHRRRQEETGHATKLKPHPGARNAKTAPGLAAGARFANEDAWLSGDTLPDTLPPVRNTFPESWAVSPAASEFLA